MDQVPVFIRINDMTDHYKELTDEQLNKLSTHRLLNIYKMNRSSEYGDRIKAVLDTREHVPRKKTHNPPCQHKFDEGIEHYKNIFKGRLKHTCKLCGRIEYKSPDVSWEWMGYKDQD